MSRWVIEWSPRRVRVWDPAGVCTVGESAIEAQAGKASGAVLLALARSACFVKAVPAPRLGESELRQMLSLQLDQHFPFAAHEAAFSFRRLGENPNGEGDLLQIAAVNAAMLSQALDDLKAAGVRPAVITASALGAEALGLDACIAVEAADSRLFLDIVQGGAVVYSRETADPGDEEGRSANAARTLAAAGLVDVPVVSLAGMDALGDGRKAPESGLQLLASREPSLVLEHPRVQAERNRRKVNWRFASAGLMALAAAGAGFLVLGDRLQDQTVLDRVTERRQVQIDQINKEAKPVTDALKVLEEGSPVLQTVFTPAQAPSDILVVAANALPPGAWLTGITFERGKPLQLRGTAKTQADVGAYVSSLSATGRLRDVKLNFANESSIDESPVFQFSITSHVIGNLPLETQRGGGSARTASAGGSR